MLKKTQKMQEYIANGYLGTQHLVELANYLEEVKSVLDTDDQVPMLLAEIDGIATELKMALEREEDLAFKLSNLEVDVTDLHDALNERDNQLKLAEKKIGEFISTKALDKKATKKK